jgi:hypothetical protein
MSIAATRTRLLLAAPMMIEMLPHVRRPQVRPLWQ